VLDEIVNAAPKIGAKGCLTLGSFGPCVLVLTVLLRPSPALDLLGTRKAELDIESSFEGVEKVLGRLSRGGDIERFTRRHLHPRNDEMKLVSAR
jgi:hypothetical protein